MPEAVLIIESTFFIRSLLKRTLKDVPNLVVEDVFDAGEAREAIAGSKFRLFVLDLNLHGEDGLSLLAELKSLPQSPAVIALSSNSARLKLAEEAKADAMLKIPLDLEIFKAKIVEILGSG